MENQHSRVGRGICKNVQKIINHYSECLENLFSTNYETEVCAETLNAETLNTFNNYLEKLKLDFQHFASLENKPEAVEGFNLILSAVKQGNIFFFACFFCSSVEIREIKFYLEIITKHPSSNFHRRKKTITSLQKMKACDIQIFEKCSS